jgi:tight adherence protein B
MLEILLAIGLLVALAGIWLLFRWQSQRRAALRLLDLELAEDEPLPVRRPTDVAVRPFARRHRVLPWLGAAVVGALLWWVTSWPLLFVAALTLVVGLLLTQLDALLLTRKMDLVEQQLADAIGLVIAAVQVGASLQASLENALRESRAPLRPILEEVVGRIRYGDDPVEVMRGLRLRVPLETFNLFATSMAVNWRVGGSISAVLAKVEGTIRDRIETTRRIRALTVQSRVSMVSVLLATYLIAALIWRNDPDRMSSYLASVWGQRLTALAIGLQGVGIAWISYLSKPKF